MRWLVLLTLGTAFAQYPGIIEGTVADVTGASLPGAIADLGEWEAGPPIAEVQTDAKGRFQFPAVLRGTYYLRFRKAGFYIRRKGPITISNEDRINTGTVHLSISLAAIGCCNCEAGPPRLLRTPASRASFGGRVNAIRMDLNGEAVLTPSDSPNPPIKFRVEDDGSFKFQDLAPGRYSLRITVPSYAPFEIPQH